MPSNQVNFQLLLDLIKNIAGSPSNLSAQQASVFENILGIILDNRGPSKDLVSAFTYAPTINIDFSADNVKLLSLTGNVTFTTSNKAIGRQKIIKITADSSVRNFTFPAGWVFIGNAAPTSIAANKTAILSLYCFDVNETDVVASYSVQQ